MRLLIGLLIALLTGCSAARVEGPVGRGALIGTWFFADGAEPGGEFVPFGPFETVTFRADSTVEIVETGDSADEASRTWRFSVEGDSVIFDNRRRREAAAFSISDEILVLEADGQATFRLTRQPLRLVAAADLLGRWRLDVVPDGDVSPVPKRPFAAVTFGADGSFHIEPEPGDGPDIALEDLSYSVADGVLTTFGGTEWENTLRLAWNLDGDLMALDANTVYRLTRAD